MGEGMSNLGPNDAKQRYESVHDFVRRAVAEAKLVISEFEKTQIEIEAAAPSVANIGFTSKSRHSEAKANVS